MAHDRGPPVGFSTDTHPVVLPMAYAVDPHGPDRDGTLYLHGSVAARMLQRTETFTLCVTVTLVDGLVWARSRFHHSMNYRSVVVIGPVRHVEDETERARALDQIIDHMVAGRSQTLRAPTRRELAATAVLALPLHEASVKVRQGAPVDEPSDDATGSWAGHVPVSLSVADPITDEFSREQVPTHVLERVRYANRTADQ
ncbi:MAG: pyridoxamine 5'-phosphate oxidase family protein [Ornithinimicrobium sp.]|uniref:pyridoxamine 5'-phosphate oxidase family protein n=1 Tax=Ornithinimicrobium sp. TaxID=1977084 RepID=UPI003D9B57A4